MGEGQGSDAPGLRDLQQNVELTAEMGRTFHDLAGDIIRKGMAGEEVGEEQIAQLRHALGLAGDSGAELEAMAEEVVGGAEAEADARKGEDVDKTGKAVLEAIVDAAQGNGDWDQALKRLEADKITGKTAEDSAKKLAT